MVTATAFQILVSNNGPVKAVTDNAVVTLEVRLSTAGQGGTYIRTMASGLRGPTDLLMLISGSAAWNGRRRTHHRHHGSLRFVRPGAGEPHQNSILKKEKRGTSIWMRLIREQMCQMYL